MPNESGIIYCRVSSSKQAKGSSPEHQEAACRDAAERRGIEISRVFIDAGKSGTSIKGRDALQEAIDFVIDNEVKYFFVTETDRFARNSMDHKLTKNLLREAGCKLVALNQAFTESEEPESELMDGLVSQMNEYYSKVISVKTKRGMKTKIANGGWPHKSKPGYLNVAVTDGATIRHIIKVDESKRHLIVEAFQRYATGEYNDAELNKIMFADGLCSTPGNKMAKSKFAAMLKDPFYIGQMKWKGVLYEKANHEALIDKATWDLCQEVRKVKNGFANRERKHSELFFLRHILKCGICEGNVCAELHEKKGVAYYHCSLTKGIKHSNAGQNFRSEELEEVIADQFKRIQFTQPLMEKIIDRAKDILDETHNGKDKKAKTIQNRMIKLKTRRQNVETDRADRVIDAEAYQRLSEDIRVELESLQKQLNEAEEERDDSIDVFSRLMALTDDLHQTYTKAEPHLKQHLLSLFFKRIYIRDRKISNIEHTEIIASMLKNRAVIISDEWLSGRVIQRPQAKKSALLRGVIFSTGRQAGHLVN
jgi:site-specific DNA recombinase